MEPLRRLLSLLFALALIAAACDGDDEEVVPTTAPTTTATTTPATTEPGTTAPATTTTTGPAVVEPTGSARFLIAENFWVDWDPYQHTAQSQKRIEAQIFDYLVDFPGGDLSNPQPMLATGWTQIDGRTWEFELRGGVVFHDGSAFDAEDVKASIELGSGATGKPTLLASRWIPTTVGIVDPLTVRLTSERPFAALFPVLRDTIIVSADDLANNPEGIKTQPNGTGPFKLVSNEVTRKVMEANLDYWRGPPQIAEVIWEFIQDPDTRLSALLAGQADAIDRVPPQHLQVIEGSDNLVLSSVTGFESVNLGIPPGRFPLWDESPEFREAVMRSIDREAIVANLVQGKSVVATSHLPPGALYHVPQEPAYTRDVEAARSLLAEAGVIDGGPEFEIWVASGFLPRAEEVVSAIVANLEEVGLKPKVVTTDLGGLIDDLVSNDGTGAMYHLSWSSNGDTTDHAQVYGSAFAWRADERIDELLDAVASAIDPQEREKLAVDLQAYLWDQLYVLSLYNSDFTIAHSADLQNLDVQPSFHTIFYPASIS